jgi:hypothetical protein
LQRGRSDDEQRELPDPCEAVKSGSGQSKQARSTAPRVSDNPGRREGSRTLAPKARGSASPRRPIAGKAQAREANEHHRPGRRLGDRVTEDELSPVANNRQIDIRSEA